MFVPADLQEVDSLLGLLGWLVVPGRSSAICPPKGFKSATFFRKNSADPCVSGAPSCGTGSSLGGGVGGLRLVSQKIQWQLREEEQSPKSVKLSPPLFVVPGLYIFI